MPHLAPTHRALAALLLLAAGGCAAEPRGEAAAAAGAPPAAPLTARPAAPGPYRLVSARSGMVLDVAGASAADGAPLHQWPYVGGANQQWRLSWQDDGSAVLRSVHGDRALDLPGSSQAAGTQLIQYTAHGGANQRWWLRPATGGFTLVSAASGQCVDVSGASRARGAAVLQWPCSGAANQLWYLEAVDEVHGGGGSPPPTPGSAACPTPAVPASGCLVTAYAQCNYGGPPVCLRRAQGYSPDDLAALGLPARALRSLKVAPGYYAFLYPTLDPNDDVEVVKRGDVACLDNESIGAKVQAIGVRQRTTCRLRPRIFMAMHGANALATGALDDQWPTVRAHLDGLWGNDANISMDEEVAIWRKVQTRTLIEEWDVGDHGQNWMPNGVFAALQQQHPDVVLNREALALFKPGNMWNADDIASLRQAYVTDPSFAAPLLFKHIYAGWQPQSFLLPQDVPTGQPPPRDAAAQAVFDQSAGTAVECGGAICQMWLRRALLAAMAQTHANGRPFVWFSGTAAPYDTWFTDMQNQYVMLESRDALRPNDVVMVINYGGGMPPTPELDASGQPARTVTGILHWLLQQ